MSTDGKHSSIACECRLGLLGIAVAYEGSLKSDLFTVNRNRKIACCKLAATNVNLNKIELMSCNLRFIVISNIKLLKSDKVNVACIAICYDATPIALKVGGSRAIGLNVFKACNRTTAETKIFLCTVRVNYVKIAVILGEDFLVLVTNVYDNSESTCLRHTTLYGKATLGAINIALGLYLTVLTLDGVVEIGSRNKLITREKADVKAHLLANLIGKSVLVG